MKTLSYLWGPMVGTKLLLITVVLLSVSSCVLTDGGFGPPPMGLVELRIDLPPGASESYEFEIEAETFDANWPVNVRMVPEAETLRAGGLIVERSWTRKGNKKDGWPDSIDDIGTNKQMSATLFLTLTNESQAGVDRDLAVIITSGGDVPAPREDELKVSIRLR